MKKTIFKAIAVLFLAALFPAGLIAKAISLPTAYGDTYYAELSKMYTRLKETTGKKIVIIGGSNVAFGIDTEQMEREIDGYTVCPFGLYAAVGTSAMLSLSENHINGGDIVVLAIEPGDDTLSTYFGAEAMLKCAESDKSLLKYLNRDQKNAAAGALYDYIKDKMLIESSGQAPLVSGVYALSSFDENCNMIFKRAGNNMALGFDSSAPVDFGAVTISEGLNDQINEYTKKAEEKGAKVFVSFSPVNKECVIGDEEGVNKYYEMLDNRLDAEVISDPNKYILDPAWFYDNNFHLNSAGAKVRTHYLVCDILAALGIYKEPEFEMPDIPEAIDVSAPSNIKTGTDAFIFEEYKGGYVITGLTDEGKSLSDITIPKSYDQRPVAGFKAEVFAGNNTVNKITIPDTIEFIPDNAFSGTENLEYLVIDGNDSVPALGDEPFKGNDKLKIYVSKEAYPLYRDGAGCEENKWQNYLNRIVTY